MYLYYAIFLTIVPQAAEEGVDLSGSKRAAQGALAAIFCLVQVGLWVSIPFNILLVQKSSLGIRSFAQSLVMVLHLLINMVILRHYLK